MRVSRPRTEVTASAIPNVGRQYICWALPAIPQESGDQKFTAPQTILAALFIADRMT
jgi:hypothetical protein